MIRGASEISSGKYSTIVDVHGSGEVYRELGLAISSYLGNREVNFDLGLVRGFIKGRRIRDVVWRISDVVWRLRVFFPDDGHRVMLLIKKAGYGTPDGANKLYNEMVSWLEGL